MAARKMSLKNLKKVKPSYPDTMLVQNGKPTAAIVKPAGGEFSEIAKEVQGRIKALTGAELPIVSDKSVAKVPEQNLILLGNLNNNQIVFRLYGYNYTPADDLYPGKGGHLVQTIHDPWGNGHNAVGLFGSDTAGVKTSVGRFLKRLRKGDTLRVKRTFDVAFGPDALKIGGLQDTVDLDAEKAAAEEALSRGEHTGLWGRIGERGLMYGLTGNEDYARLYKWLVLRMYKHAMSDPDNYGGIWGFDADFPMHKVLPGWDLVEESPSVSDKDRMEITRILSEYVAHAISHVGNMNVDHVRHNHTTFAALGLHYAGVYYRKYYNAREADEWLALSDKCFRFQAKAHKPHEDCSGYQWLTHYHVTKWALSKGDMTFFRNGCAKMAGDYSILTTDNLGYALPYGDNASPFGWWSELPYLRALVAVTGDGRYQWMLDKKMAVAPSYGSYQYHHRVDPVEPTDLDGTQSFPVDPHYYTSNNGTKHLPYKKTFDKVVMRDGFDPEGQYLFLDGLSNGGHKHYDGNSISRITENRRIWLADCDYIKSLPKFHNGVLIFKNGQSAPIPDFAELERVADLGASGFSETTLRKYSGVDWHRNIIWNRGKYFLVADEMSALAEDDYSFRAIWQTVGNVEVAEGGLAVEQDGEHFYIKGLPGPRLKLEADEVTGKNWSAYKHADPVVHILQQIADVHLKKGETYTYFNLMYCSDEAQPQDLKMTQVCDGAVRIEGGDEAVFAGVGDPSVVQKIPGGPEVAAAQFHVSPSRFSLVDGTSLVWNKVAIKADSPVSIEFDPTTGEGVVIAGRRTKLRVPGDSSTDVTVDGKAVAAQSSGGTRRFVIPAGTHRIALVPKVVAQLAKAASKPARPRVSRKKMLGEGKSLARDLKPLWSYTSGGAFLTLSAADLNGDGVEEVIAAGRGGSVSAVSKGKALWKFQTGGEVRSVCAADLQRDGKPEVIVGSADTKVYVLNSKGKKQWDFEIPLYYRKPMLKTVFAGDIDGDGNLEVIAGAESWRYYAFTHDGKELWHHMTVHSSTHGCAADIDGDGKDEVIAGTEYYWWTCINGNGEKRWGYHTGTGPRTNWAAAGDLTGDGKKEVLFAGADTNVHALDAEGKLLWQFNTGDEVTQVATADMDGDGKEEVIASSMSFNVYVVKGNGKTQVWRTDLGEVVRCIAVADFNGDGKLEVAAGTEDGKVHLLRNRDGRSIGVFETGGPVLTLAAADVDGDGNPEILAASEDEKLYALKP